MSEFNIEAKANAYDNAIKRAKELLSKCKCDKDRTTMIYRAKDIESIFPELKKFTDEEIRKWLVGYFQEYKSNGVECYSNGLKVDTIIDWIERQPLNNPKNEPKFNLYDWVITDKGNIVQICAINNGYYTIHNGMDFNMSYVDKCWRKWTFDDAEEGDVLCTYEWDEPKIVFILKEKAKKHYALRYHCYYNIMYPYCDFNSEKGCLAVNEEELKPATKEQRDILFQKMREAGYEWNFNKKELIKLKND